MTDTLQQYQPVLTDLLTGGYTRIQPGDIIQMQQTDGSALRVVVKEPNAVLIHQGEIPGKPVTVTFTGQSIAFRTDPDSPWEHRLGKPGSYSKLPGVRWSMVH